jgi:hypothetical protein
MSDTVIKYYCYVGAEKVAEFDTPFEAYNFMHKNGGHVYKIYIEKDGHVTFVRWL